MLRRFDLSELTRCGSCRVLDRSHLDRNARGRQTLIGLSPAGWGASWVWLALLLLPAVGAAQQLNHFHSAGLPPGAVGQDQAYRIPNGQGYFQPVEVTSSGGATVSLLHEGRFTPAESRINAALLVGGVYSYRVTNIPDQPGAELFPSIEVIHRLYPPDGLAARFPIQVDLNTADLQAALEGNFVVKVVYLEDPEASQTVTRDGLTQPTFDLAPGSDLLSTADLMGRPMAIVRIGSRILEAAEVAAARFGPPLTLLPPTTQQPPTATIQWNQAYADRDPSYIPQMIPPRDGHARLWNAEHIFDGGDRSVRALVGSGDNWEVNGLETEDTIGHFDTLDGQRHVVASNRVGIYSPRFGSVRQSLNVALAIREMPALSAESTTLYGVKGSKAQATTTAQWDQLRQMREAAAAQGVRQRTAPTWSNGAVGTIETVGTDAPAVLVSLLQKAELSNSQKAMIAKGRQAALTWGGVEGVQAIADFQSAQIVYDVTKADEIVESHSPNQRPKLQVIKLASQDAAQPGDVVDFVLRFKNVGDQTIGNVTLLDNLPDRLEFVVGSASCDRACQFYTQDNEMGSVILRWDIEKPLPVNEGGVIRFSCRVR